MAFQNPSTTEIRAFLQRTRTIAVVGLSPDPDRPSYGVSMYMQEQGYRIVPVRPGVDQVLGEPAYPSLDKVPVPIDLVQLFRNPRHVSAHVDEAIRLGVPALWLQEGVIDEAAALRAQRAGLFVVMDRCTLKEHRQALP